MHRMTTDVRGILLELFSGTETQFRPITDSNWKTVEKVQGIAGRQHDKLLP
jgi:hypothetical protein